MQRRQGTNHTGPGGGHQDWPRASRVDRDWAYVVVGIVLMCLMSLASFA